MITLGPRSAIAAADLALILLIRECPNSIYRTVGLLCCACVAVLVIVFALRDIMDPPLE